MWFDICKSLIEGKEGIIGIDLSWMQIWYNLMHLGIAYLLALPVAYDRERSTRGAGLRTFPLVAVASCGYTLIGIVTLSDIDAQSRVLEGLITGIGFIGAGAILKGSGGVQGTATAASRATRDSKIAATPAIRNSP